jgi:hypothetical protein
VLEPVLQRLGAPLGARERDAVLQGLDGLGLGVDEPADGGPGVVVDLERSHLRLGVAAERRDLLDEVPGVLQVVSRERLHVGGQPVVGEPGHPAGHQRVGQRRAELEAQRRVERLHDLVDLHRLLLVLGHRYEITTFQGWTSRPVTIPAAV